MKKILCIWLVVILLLCGCTEQPVRNDPTNTSENTLTDGQAEQPVLETKEDAAEFLRNTEINGIYVYLRALGCTFAKPEDIPAWFYFYTGVGEKAQFTQEEKIS